jgi:hypothetical protein
VALDEAKKLCGAGDCEGAHAKLETAIAQTSPLRDTKDFRDVENKWADQLLERAGAEDDLGAKRKAYERVSRTITVDAMRRKIAADKLQQLDMVSANPAQLPQAGARPAPDEAAPPPPRPEGTGRRSAGAQLPASPPQLEMTTAATMLPVASPAPLARSTGANMDDRERQLALQGTQDSKALLKQQLEQRVSGGKASETEIRLLISTCKDLGDKACVQQARASLAQRQQ